MELKFTADTIDSIEKERGVSLELVVGDFSIRTLILLVSKGLKQGVEKAKEAIDAELVNKDTFEMQLDIIKQLESDGFLARRLKLSEKIEKKLAELSQPSLGSDGATMNPQQ